MFYDNIAAEYDEMIPLEKRIHNLKNLLGRYVDKYNIKCAVDAGSATGATCIALAQLGVDVTGIEYSSEMVKIAKKHSAQYGYKIPFKLADLQERQPEFKQKFDAVFVLANTISHFLDKRSLSRVLSNFSKWLLPGGLLVIQYLNYHRIFKDRERIVKIYKNDEKTFIRFYDFGRKTINFNLLVVENESGTPAWTLDSIPIRGWTAEEMTDLLRSMGFKSIKHQADMSGNRFRPNNSHDLVIVAKKK